MITINEKTDLDEKELALLKKYGFSMPSSRYSSASRTIDLGKTIVGDVILDFYVQAMVSIRDNNSKYLVFSVDLEFQFKSREDRDRWKDNKLDSFFNAEFIDQLKKYYKTFHTTNFAVNRPVGAVTFKIEDRDFSLTYYRELENLLKMTKGINDMVIELLKRIDFDYREPGSKTISYSRKLRR